MSVRTLPIILAALLVSNCGLPNDQKSRGADEEPTTSVSSTAAAANASPLIQQAAGAVDIRFPRTVWTNVRERQGLRERAVCAEVAGQQVIYREKRRALFAQSDFAAEEWTTLYSNWCLAADGQPVPNPTAPGSVKQRADLKKVGECQTVAVAETGSRLEGVPESGSWIRFSNNISQVSYEIVPGIQSSQPGDKVLLCLVSIPLNCPPGDDRGRVYSGTNLRTEQAWAEADSQHMCGGA